MEGESSLPVVGVRAQLPLSCEDWRRSGQGSQAWICLWKFKVLNIVQTEHANKSWENTQQLALTSAGIQVAVTTSKGHKVFSCLCVLWSGWMCVSCPLGGRKHRVSPSSHWGNFNTGHFWVNISTHFFLAWIYIGFLSGHFSLLNHNSRSEVNGAHWNSQQWK